MEKPSCRTPSTASSRDSWIPSNTPSTRASARSGRPSASRKRRSLARKPPRNPPRKVASTTVLATRTDSPDGRRPAGSVRLRPAAPDDLELLRRWDEQPHVVASAPNDEWSWETELRRSPPWREQLMAEADGRPIGFVQIIDPKQEDSHYWGCISEGHRAIDIWIGEQDDLGRGYGSQMMKLAIERCFADPGVHTILVDPLESNTRSHRFYERLGFEYVVCRRFGEDCCFVYKLKRPD